MHLIQVVPPRDPKIEHVHMYPWESLITFWSKLLVIKVIKLQSLGGTYSLVYKEPSEKHLIKS